MRGRGGEGRMHRVVDGRVKTLKQERVGGLEACWEEK